MRAQARIGFRAGKLRYTRSTALRLAGITHITLSKAHGNQGSFKGKGNCLTIGNFDKTRINFTLTFQSKSQHFRMMMMTMIDFAS
jgi:hypothetical protein